MAKVGIVSSVGAGFALIARRPGAVVVWGLIYLVLSVAPSILAYRAGGPDLIEFYRHAITNPASLQSGQIPPGLVAMQRFQGLQILGSLLAIAVVYTAIQRAVIFPEQKSWFSLRLSWAEFRTIAIAVILYVAFAIAVTVAALIIMVPVIIAAASAGDGPEAAVRGIGLGVAAIFGVLLALAYPAGRLAMAIPMSVGEDRFRLFEAWKFTKGYGWRLVLIFLILMLIFLVIEAVVFIILGVGAVSVIGSLQPAEISAFFQRPNWMKDAMGWLVLAGLCWGALMLVAAPLVVAPWAEVYRRIAGVRTQDAHAVFD